MKSKIFFIIFILMQWGIGGYAQETEYPYARDIQKFKEADRINPPPKDAILFVGSSSFTMWQDVQDYFPGYTIINRGFGGSTISNLVHYREDVIYPYLPKQIVIYCGENDIAYSDTVTGELVAERLRTLFSLIRSRLPDARITYISMKPSPSRWHMRDRFIHGNMLIQEFLEGQQNAVFINIWDDMLDKQGMPKAHIFLDDELHMNEKGYKIWQKALKPELMGD